MTSSARTALARYQCRRCWNSASREPRATYTETVTTLAARLVLSSSRPSVSELLDCINRFVSSRGWKKFHSPKNLSIALAVEAAEVQEHFQWITEEESWRLGTRRIAMLKDEIGDVAIYLFELAAILGIDPIDAAFAKIRKNEKKFATVGSGRTSEQYDWRLAGIKKR